LAKSLAPSAAACNGMMRSMYQHHHAGRAYPYPACSSMAAARYAPHQFMNTAAAAAAAGYTQFSAGMPASMQAGMYAGSAAAGNMTATSAHGQQSTQRLPMAADYGLALVSYLSAHAFCPHPIELLLQRKRFCLFLYTVCVAWSCCLSVVCPSDSCPRRVQM